MCEDDVGVENLARPWVNGRRAQGEGLGLGTHVGRKNTSQNEWRCTSAVYYKTLIREARSKACSVVKCFLSLCGTTSKNESGHMETPHLSLLSRHSCHVIPRHQVNCPRDRVVAHVTGIVIFRPVFVAREHGTDRAAATAARSASASAGTIPRIGKPSSLESLPSRQCQCQSQ